MNQEQTPMLTEISARQWDFVTQEQLSVQEVIAFLYSGMRLRTFPELLQRVWPHTGAETLLVQGLCQQEPDANPDSIRRKVRNWFSGKNMPTNREDVFRICFALNLDPDQSDELLASLTGQGVHYRSIQEMAYAYSLRCRQDYAYARRLARELSRQDSRDSSREPVTQILRQEFRGVRGEEDLFSFILRNQSRLGARNNTAYAYFCKMLAILTGEDLPGEKTYSMEAVAEQYLRMGIPEERKTARYSDIQKMVKKYWPGARSIKAMHSRSEDVSRKTLLLLYLVTGGILDKNYDELDESYIQPREFLEQHCQRLNRILKDCGMAVMDPRNVFDYLILYCLRPEDQLFMSERMEALTAELFAE